MNANFKQRGWLINVKTDTYMCEGSSSSLIHLRSKRKKIFDCHIVTDENVHIFKNFGKWNKFENFKLNLINLWEITIVPHLVSISLLYFTIKGLFRYSKPQFKYSFEADLSTPSWLVVSSWLIQSPTERKLP